MVQGVNGKRDKWSGVNGKRDKWSGGEVWWSNGLG